MVTLPAVYPLPVVFTRPAVAPPVEVVEDAAASHPALHVEPLVELTEEQMMQQRIARYRPLAVPAEFEERTFDRLVSEDTSRMAALVKAFPSTPFSRVGTLNLAGFYPNPKELTLLFDTLASLGPLGPTTLK
jgi:hypothetical protein